MRPAGAGRHGERRVRIDERTFHSTLEGARYLELRHLEERGAIAGLECQPSYRIEANGRHVCRVVPDFRYVRGEETVVEDVKGHQTETSRLKRALMAAMLGIEVALVREADVARWAREAAKEIRESGRAHSTRPGQGG